MVEPQTGTVTILFTDLEGSTDLLSRMGDYEARTLWRTHLDLLRGAVVAQGGQEVKNLGDGLMAVFTSTKEALTCAISMQQAVHRHNQLCALTHCLRVRVGIHVGEPIHDEEDYFGSAVVLAKRICDHARGGQILISDVVRGIAGESGHFEFSSLGPSRFRGFREAVSLYEVEWQREESPAAIAIETLSERTPFVGRKNERSRLRSLLQQASRGHGAVVMIGGEPGVGKTRIVEEISSESRAIGLLTLAGNCSEMPDPPPYTPFVEIFESAMRLVKRNALMEALDDAAPDIARIVPGLRRLFPEIPASAELPWEQERQRIFDSIREFLIRACRVQPMLLVLEDLQWADRSTLFLLRHIAQQIHDMAILMVCTYRDAELDDAPDLAMLIEKLKRQRLLHRLTIGRLSKTNVAGMLRGRTGKDAPPKVVKLIFKETEGNPLFVEEVFRHLVEEGKLFDADGQWRTDLEADDLGVPEGIRLIVDRRLERVSKGCRHVLAAAAVIGRGFKFKLLKELVDLDEEALLDAIDAAERTLLITAATSGGEVSYTFSHELIRQTLVHHFSLPRRQRLHLRVAQALERIHAGSPETHAAEIVHHLCQAGSFASPGKTLHYLMITAEKAFEAAAFEDAIRLYDTAIVRAADDPHLHAELLHKRGLVLRSTGQWEEALADWREALALSEKIKDTEATGCLCAEISSHLIRDARFEEAYEVATRGLVALGDRVNASHSLLLAAAGFVLSYVPVSGYGGPSDLFTRSLEMAHQLGDERLLGPILARKTALHHTYWQGRDAAGEGERAAELLRSTNDLYDLGYALAYAQCGLIWLGRLDRAAQIEEEAEAITTGTGNDIARWLGGHYQSFREVALTANLSQFEKKRRELLEMNRATGSGWLTVDHAALGRAHLWRGEWEKARESFRMGLESDTHGVMSGYCNSQMFLIEAYEGNEQTAEHMFRSLTDMLPIPGQPNAWGTWTVLDASVQGLSALGRKDELAGLYPLTLEAIASGNVIRAAYEGMVQTTAGIAATAARQWENAEEHFLAALRQADDVPHKIERAEARRWYANMLMEHDGPGDRETARELLNEAATMYRQIGMPRHLQMAESSLERLSA